MGLLELIQTEWRRAKELRYLQIEFDPERCDGTWQCVEVCPVGRWSANQESRLPTIHEDIPCTACGACVLQCPQDAIKLIVQKSA